MHDHEIILSVEYPEAARHLRYCIWLAASLLAVGLIAPVITLNKFVLIENTFSIVSGVIQLLEDGQVLLFLVITAFSIVLPILKLMILYELVSSYQSMYFSVRKQLHWMHLYGKWSMLDVFVVAVLVATVKLDAIANVEMRYGLYAFAASVILTMLITSRIVNLVKRPA